MSNIVNDRKMHTIDATNKILGRLATRIALILTGKRKVSYSPNMDMGDEVIVNNASKMKFSGRKLEQKIYYRHSGYPGGLKEKKMKEIFAKDPSELLKKAVYNMLPKNKLRSPRMNKFKINN